MKKAIVTIMLSLLALTVVACGPKAYTVTFMVDGAEYKAVGSIESGATVELPSNPTKTGFRFNGWYAEGAEEKFSPDAAIESDLVLNAKFDENEYKVEFSACGGEGEMNSLELRYTQESALPECTFTYTDKLFAGWALSASGEAEYADGATVSKLTAEHEATVTLYAVWNRQFYTIKFNGNGGLGSMSDTDVDMSRETALTANAFVRQGYHFLGWATTADGEVKYADGATVSRLTTEAGEEINLYAVWERDYYTVRFAGGEGVTGTMEDQKFEMDDEKALTANAFTKTNFDFKGWATEPNGEVIYLDGATVSGLATKNGAVVTLYAVFKGAPETYVILTRTENAEGGFDDNRETKNAFFGDTITITPEPKTGYEATVANNGATLDGGDDTEITITYTLIDYTAKLVGKYGATEFTVAEETFNYLTESFSLTATDSVEEGGVTYRYIDKGNTFTIAKNTAQNVTLVAEYGIEVTDAAALMSAMNNHPDKSVVFGGDIDMTSYLAANPWNDTNVSTGALFNKNFSGTMDGKGYSLLGIKSTSGYIERTKNVIFSRINANGTIRNLHLQASFGIKNDGGGGKRLSVLFGEMYGTVDNCFFDLDVDFEVDWKLYGGAPIWDLSDTSVVRNTVFYIPTASGLRCFIATTYGGAFEGKGTFDNVVHIYKSIGYGDTALPTIYNPNLSNVYVVTADSANGIFKDFRKLNETLYNSEDGVQVQVKENGEPVYNEDGTPKTKRASNNIGYWDETTADNVTTAMNGFTFTEKALKYGEKTIFDFNRIINVSNAEELVSVMNDKPWANIELTRDIDMADYLAANPWDSTDAFFTKTFSGTLDGKGHSILNLKSTAGMINRWQNVVFKEVSPTGKIKNLHMQVALGLQEKGGFRKSVLFGGMYGSIDNCFFDVDVEFSNPNESYCTATIYDVSDTSSVTNTVFYVPNSVSMRMMVASSWGGDYEARGTFNNLVYIYGDTRTGDAALPFKYNAGISNIYAITADTANGAFNGFKKLDKAAYDAGAGAEGSTAFNSADYWTASSAEEITEAMSGFTFTDKTLKFGDKTVCDLNAAIQVSNAEELVSVMKNKPWANIELTQDIDMTDYLAANPWSDSEAFFNYEFSGTLDGKGHSILNLKSTAGVIDRWQNAVFKKITGTIKNLHLQVSIGSANLNQDRSVVFGEMFGTLENCFFDIDSDFGDATDMSKAGPIYWLNDNSVVRNCVFYIPNAKGLRMLRAENTDPTVLGKGTFENVAYIYGSIDFNNSLQGIYNENISGIYAITADTANGAFNGFKKLDKTAYDAGAGAAENAVYNSADYWTDETAATITLGDSVITGKTLKFGNTTIADLNVTEGE